MGRMRTAGEAEDSLSVRAAWLHYAGGMTQAEVAQRLGISAVKVSRLIAHAAQNGAVRITVEGPVAECLELESRLERRFGLSECRVAPDLREVGLPLRALGREGAQFLDRLFADAPGLIGIGHGRTLGAAIAELPRRQAKEQRVVALMGGLTRNFAASPHDVMYKIAERTQATARVMPVPFLANSPEDRALLLQQRGISEVLTLWSEVDVLIAGIGTTTPDAQLVDSGMIGTEDIEEVRRSGAAGEILGHFFDPAGTRIDSALSARTLSPDPGILAGRRIIAIAGGAAKVGAIRAVLASGLLSGLITDEQTATAILSA